MNTTGAYRSKSKSGGVTMRKPAWMAVTLLLLMVLLVGSCTTAKQEPTTQPATTQPTVQPTVTQTPQQPAADLVTLNLKKLDGTVVTKTVERPRYGGVLTFLYPGTQKSMELFQQTEAYSSSIQSFVYERLGTGDWARGPAGTGEYSFYPRYTPDHLRIGQLATSWEQPDPLTFIFHIRKGVRFHDVPPTSGREMTADDVAFSLNYSLKQPMGLGRYITNITSVVALDKWTVKVTFKDLTIDSLFMVTCQNFTYIFPREVIDKYGDTSNWKAIAGTGPFMMEDFVVDSSLLLKRNPNYWGHDELFPENQLPYVDKVKLLYITDIATMIASLRTAKIDKMGEFEPQQADAIRKSNPELTEIKFVRLTAMPVVLWRLDKAPYSDIRVRRALSNAINRQAIIDSLFGGKGEFKSYPVSIMFPDSYVPLDQAPQSVREFFEYNPERAKKLLTEAGYPNGFTQEILVTAGTVQERMEIIASYWEAIGVKSTFRVAEPTAFTSEVFSFKYPNVCGMTAGQSSDYGALGYNVTDSRNNGNRQKDPTYDAMYNAITREFDVAKRNQMVKDLEMYYFEQAYCLTFPFDYVSSFWWPWLKNHHGEQAIGQFYLVGPICARAWIDQDLKMKMKGK